MRITILNNSALKDRHINRLKKIGDIIVYERTIGETEAIQRLIGTDIAIIDCSDVPVSRKLLRELPMLKYIVLNSTGYEQVDIQAVAEYGTIISNAPDYSTNSVAEHTFALMLSLARQIPKSNEAMLDAPFEIDLSEKKHCKYLGQTLNSKTLGIIGLGKIGSKLTEFAMAFGMKTIAYGKSLKPIKNVTMSDFYDLLKTSDFISINASYEIGLKNLIDEKAISMMKKNAFIINTSRGEFIDEYALASAIKNRKIGGFAADVLYNKTETSPLLDLDNVILTPHLAFFTEEALGNLADAIIENVESYIANKPKNIIKTAQL